jgi:hypothetical protein
MLPKWQSAERIILKALRKNPPDDASAKSVAGCASKSL